MSQLCQMVERTGLNMVQIMRPRGSNFLIISNVQVLKLWKKNNFCKNYTAKLNFEKLVSENYKFKFAM